jgi:hypothetical protein
MVIEYILIVIVIALIRKGSLKQLTDTDIKLWYVFIFSLLIQVSAMYFYSRSPFVNQTYPIWIIGSYIILLCGIGYNLSLAGFKLFGLGTFLNFLVITANGGRMPVSAEALEVIGLSTYIPELMKGVTKHQLVTSETHVWFLADIIPLGPPFAMNSSVISVGDIFITLGLSWFIYKGMVR